MASLLATKVCNSLFLISLFSIYMVALSVSAYHQFDVGGARGWIEPTGNETDTYDDWATRNRFHVGDSVYFKYENDSVLIVNYTDYTDCIVSNPISKFDNGNTVFRFNRYGFFYFISGNPGHCNSGQKLVIRVMVHSEVEPPESAPSPEAGGGPGGGKGGSSGGGHGSGFLQPNSTVKLSVRSSVMTALVGMLAILHMFM